MGHSESGGSVGKEAKSQRGRPTLVSPGSYRGSERGDQNWWETEL